MAQREFEYVSRRVGSSMRLVSTIECSRCPAVSDYVHVGSKKPSVAVEQYFRNHGWSVGRVAKKDVCPACQMQTRKEKPVAKAAKPAEPEIVVTPAPRQMDRDDRRLIFAKIDEVYEKDGYVVPWTDAAVAKHLGVPRAWVSQVRDEMFGPAGSNPELDAYLTQVEELTMSIEQAKDDFAKVIDGLVEKQGELSKLARKIEKEIGR